jgi:hypothetical protein
VQDLEKRGIQQKKIGLGIVVVVLIVAAYFLGGSLDSGAPLIDKSGAPNPTTNVITNTEVKATTGQVPTFYNGQDGYSVSIPSGNNSTCIWTWVDGNAAIPYTTTTYANSAAEKHTIEISNTASNWEVTCVDDFGNRYVGIFPLQ